MSACPPSDLAQDPSARRARKRPVEVRVEFAPSAGTLRTHEGDVRYRAGDALVSGALADRWPVPRATFDASYLPVPPTRAGEGGIYRKQARDVLVRRMDGPFSVTLGDGRGDLAGAAGDWLVQYAPGDLAIVAGAIFGDTYELLDK